LFCPGLRNQALTTGLYKGESCLYKVDYQASGWKGQLVNPVEEEFQSVVSDIRFKAKVYFLNQTGQVPEILPADAKIVRKLVQ